MPFVSDILSFSWGDNSSRVYPRDGASCRGNSTHNDLSGNHQRRDARHKPHAAHRRRPRLVAQAVQQTINPDRARLSVWHGAKRLGLWWDYSVETPQTGVSRTLSPADPRSGLFCFSLQTEQKGAYHPVRTDVSSLAGPRFRHPVRRLLAGSGYWGSMCGGMSI